ncbi:MULTISPECIES: signal peptidase I [Nocardiaceae]|uniref:Signal peptidase I n=1 Tax=Rhodococcoides kroppenstedtii TaxID=293050 RepID=A0ABS7NVX3_9NOCA|nr:MULTISPECIES: signal peptidase I [Rhodococcus]AMY20853.1 Signal peptidase I W [Rhodococcus sp. PBTS 1]MBY6313459.1 signal peptidase I [Rhodococcus kroppenstedtii]MBY6321535.1 signal peptidase I [Rhodococcus kroppenstedtii]MBY6349225.1 signal peptidase I [Rhodococcus corynebacterioides]MBY6400233.1 signal peptidase I [Rhodococcus kroppenstedtii]
MTTHRIRRPDRRLAARIADAVLSVLAAGGVVCIVAVALSVTMNISLIMFKTGSMSPTIPTGSLAVVREVPAASVVPGDVVTVARVGELPVTHRVVRTSPSAGGATLLELKGDANDYPDPAGYSVTEVRKVLWSMPGLARVVVWFSNPFVLGALTIAMTVLVVVVFWPRTPKQRT